MLETYRDPLCGRLLAPVAITPKSEYRGKTYYFCCDLCKQLFDREPQKYALEKDGKDEQNIKGDRHVMAKNS